MAQCICCLIGGILACVGFGLLIQSMNPKNKSWIMLGMILLISGLALGGFVHLK